VSLPDNAPVVDDSKRVTQAWLLVFTQWLKVISSMKQSGTTAQRPVSPGLWVGRQYFDTTLGHPVWVKQVTPSVVWVDATGTTV
jgi:hypothetical protein